MVTKWRNKKWLIALVWLALFSHGVHGLGTALYEGKQYIGKNYFQTESFQTEWERFIDGLFVFEIDYIPIEEAKQMATVTDEEIREHRYRYGDLNEQIENIKGQYEPKIEQAKANQSERAVEAYQKERDEKIEDITQNFLSDEHVRKKVAREKEERIEKYYEQLDQHRVAFYKEQSPYFIYRLTDKETDRVFSNVPEKERAEKFRADELAYIKNFASLNRSRPSDRLDVPDPPEELELAIQKRATVVQGQIAATKEAQSSPGYKAFQSQLRLFYSYTASGMLALLVSLFVLKKWDIPNILAPKARQDMFNRVPFDLALFALVVAFFVFVDRFEGNHLYRLTTPGDAIKDLFVTSAWTAIGLSSATYLRRRLKEKPDLRAHVQNSALTRLWEAAREAFLIRGTGTQVLLILSIALAVGPGLILTMTIDAFLAMIYFAIACVFGLLLLYVILRQTGYFNQIALNLEQIAQGNAPPDLPVKGKSKLAKMAENVNRLKQGVKISEKERAKSERLKTELITNVSHDLRTPLTSVINYAELLKNPELTNDEREAYIEIIDQKSKRLKTLIDDLFEVSKMASGNAELDPRKVDLVQLLRQALAEYDEPIKASSLDFRVSVPETPLYAYVDGQKLWRAFDNLIGNILKYSLENTRVYISAQSDGTTATIVFRNISKYELGENADELFERFKRGDASRQTEGSGLGLAIAKSIVDLHRGHLNIEVDGDLFKATIRLPTR